jgi:hypothetical protein
MSDKNNITQGLSVNLPQPTPGQVGHQYGMKCQSFMQKYGKSILIGFLILCTITVFLSFMGTIAEASVVDANASVLGAAASYASMAYHQKCKRRGGCSRNCPFMASDDPRVVMCKQVDGIDELNGLLRNGIERQAIDNALSHFGTDADKNEIKTTLDAIHVVKLRAISNVNNILSKAKDIDSAFGSAAEISLQVVDAKNKITGLAAAAVVNKNIFIAAVVHSNAYVMNRRLLKMKTADQQKVDNYDTKASECAAQAAAISTLYDGLVAKLSQDPSTTGLTYNDYYTVIMNATAASADVINAMSGLMNLSQSTYDNLSDMLNKFNLIGEIFEKSVNKVDRFSNDLPGKLPNEVVSQLISEDEYNTVIIKTALDADTVTSHQKFAKERATFDSGGGVPSVRDDDNDINPWVGIFGRPTYRRSDGKSAETGDEPLRSIPSDVPEDMMRVSNPRFVFN